MSEDVRDTRDEYRARIRKRIGMNLKKQRMSNLMTRKQIEIKTGINRCSIQHWEEGSHAPTVDRLYLLCKELNWKPSDILK